MKTDNCWEQIHAQQAWGKYPNEELVRFLMKKFSSLSINKRNNIKILEVGCGQGANLWFLAKEGFDTHGIDISPSAVEKAGKYIEAAYGVKATIKKADMRSIPYDNEFFDVIIDIASIQHVSFSDHKKVYKEIHRVLKPAGIFWSFHIAKESWGDKEGKIIDYETFENIEEGPLSNVGITCILSHEDLSMLLNKEGFVILNLEKHLKTYNNRQKEIYHWIIEAKRADKIGNR